MKRINTAKTLHNSYFDSDKTEETNYDGKISIASDVEENYPEMFTDDIILYQDRRDTDEKIYEIWRNSKYYDIYNSSTWGIKKIPKKYVAEIFYYVKENLEKRKKLTAMETVIAINEFFDFNYDFVAHYILSPRLKLELYQEYYENGRRHDMEEQNSKKLF